MPRHIVCLTFDFDAMSSFIARGMMSPSPISRGEFGANVGAQRILDLLKKYDAPGSWYIPGHTLETYPDHCRRVFDAGHEIGHHGYLHESPNKQSAEDELYWLQRALACFDKYVGHRPKGYRAPLNEFSKHSLSHLLREGFEYDSSLMGDDLPYLLVDEAGQLVELPQYIAMDDWPQFMHSWDLNYQMPIMPPDRAKELYLSEFDAMWESGGGLWMTVWHPFLAGRPARIKMMIQMIEYMRARGRVWFATLGEINDHIRLLLASGRWKPRTDRLPYDVSPIRELARTPLAGSDRRAQGGAG